METTGKRSQSETSSPNRVINLGVVSYLNSRPLYDAICQATDVSLTPDVPSRLIDGLMAGKMDAALLPVVDFQRHRDKLRQISDACIASDGETMTVRVFSRCPAERISTLHADMDSHTSVILVQLIWQELYGRIPKLVPWSIEDAKQFSDVEAVLLIGDKVVTAEPEGFGFEVDLGAAWKHITGLPFVFAAWYGPKDLGNAENLGNMLAAARDEGVSKAEAIAYRYAGLHGWPVELARKYLGRTLKYKLTDEAKRGMELFFEKATKAGLLP